MWASGRWTRAGENAGLGSGGVRADAGGARPGAGGCPPDGASIDQGAVEIDYGDTHAVYGEVEKKLSAVDDPAKTLIIAERGLHRYFDRIEQVAYPEACRITWSSVVERPDNCGGGHCDDWPGDVCGVYYGDIDKSWGDATWRSKYARHLGGNSLGFVDGHAAWWSAGAILAAANADPSQLPPMSAQHVPDYIPGEHW